MTEVDYPPFNYAGPDGNPTGFNVDLARLICDELKVPCTMQMRRFDTLIDALNDNKGDAAIASIAVSRRRASGWISATPTIARSGGSWRGASPAPCFPSRSTARRSRW